MDRESSHVSTLFTGFVVLLLTMALIVFSEHGYQATVSALKLFFEVVFPSLLPFFILSEVLLATGTVHFLGVFFEPLMRPLFNVPGVGSFVFSMGLAAGYPMDAVLTGKFRRQGMCSKIEAERLLSFTNSADPLFIFGAVAVGLLGHPEMGAILAAAHYASCLLVGFTFRFYGRRAERRDAAASDADAAPTEAVVIHGIWRRAVSEMVRARDDDGRPLGRVLNESIAESISTLFMIMSFMVLVAVLLRVLSVTGFLNILILPLGGLFHLLGLSPQLVSGAVQGLFEIDLGAAATAHAAAPLLQRLILLSAIIAWSGISVHAQVASVLTDTDISMKPYFVARLLHAIYAGLLTILFYGPMTHAATVLSLPAFASRDFRTVPQAVGPVIDGTHFALLLCFGSVCALALGAGLIGVIRGARFAWVGMHHR